MAVGDRWSRKTDRKKRTNMWLALPTQHMLAKRIAS